MSKLYYWNSPIGVLCIKEEHSCIVGLHLNVNASTSTDSPSPLIKQTIMQLQEYFDGRRFSFDLPLHTQGTPFQEKVWAALKTIPYGETCSYGDIAKAIGNPKAYRAVGGANNKNPIMILIPCHRVIGANGNMVGFGCGIPVKEYLLALELKNLRLQKKDGGK